MRLLISNDDGIDSSGLATLADHLSGDHEVWVVAPATEQSAKSHSLTMHDPLRVTQHASRRFAVSGTPADCVYVALHDLMPQRPDVVLAGINRGSNLGGDVHYSGTVAAAREGALHGCAAVAVSLELNPDQPEHHWDTAARIAGRVVAHLSEHAMPPQLVYNVNVPDLPLDQVRGLKATRLSVRVYAQQVDRRRDPRGRTYVWIGGPHLRFEGGSDTDGTATHDGWATLTPLSCDITHYAELERIRGWTDA